jgi:hypothetical protein
MTHLTRGAKMKSKYIIVDLNGTEVPLVFSSFLQHEDVAMGVQGKVNSAGFCELDTAGKWVACGGSVSLKLEARQQDTGILNEHLGAVSVPGQSPCKTARASLPTNANI